MEYKGSSVYEQTDFFENYMIRRNRKDSPNNAIEGPIIFELIGNFQNNSILDLGCGDASFGKELLNLGAQTYIGVEGSLQMVEVARTNMMGQSGTINFESMESYDYPNEVFDLVTSRFAIHYVSDINRLFENVYKTLQENGRFVFSIQHPLITSSFASKQLGDKRGNWIVDDYFLEGERKEPWIDQIVVKYHRTTENYFLALKQAGFSIIDLREGTPKREHFSSEDEFMRRQRIPIVLAFSCIKNAK